MHPKKYVRQNHDVAASTTVRLAHGYNHGTSDASQLKVLKLLLKYYDCLPSEFFYLEQWEVIPFVVVRNVALLLWVMWHVWLVHNAGALYHLANPIAVSSDHFA
jgi:hypothetical protein